MRIQVYFRESDDGFLYPDDPHGPLKELVTIETTTAQREINNNTIPLPYPVKLLDEKGNQIVVNGEAAYFLFTEEPKPPAGWESARRVGGKWVKEVEIEFYFLEVQDLLHLERLMKESGGTLEWNNGLNLYITR